MRTKLSPLNVDFKGASFDPLGSRSPAYVRAHQIQNARLLQLSTNLAREQLQIGTDLLLIITSTVDELFGGTNIDDLERL